MKISVIILNYNGGKDTITCLRSLCPWHNTEVHVELVVVDNGSSDGSVGLIKKEFPQIKVIVNRSNLGFAEGNNVGIKYALGNGADYILILNNDTSVNKNLIRNMLKVAQNQKKGGIFGPKIYFTKGYETHPMRYKSTEVGKVIWYAGGIMDWANILASHRGVDEVDFGQYDVIQKTDFITGCAMFIRRQALIATGMFDVNYYLYYEDVDLCERIKKSGFELWYVPEAFLWHNNAESAGGTGSELQSYYMTRNRLILGFRYASWRTKFALMREGISLLSKGNSVQKAAVWDFMIHKYGKRYG